eukprot:103665-Hanusia_phi.AAC.1
MPPESLQQRRCSDKSDVWAFGVTCWEILTRGKIPYYRLSDNNQVIAMVCAGGRLARDEIQGGCPDGAWELMESCWRANAKDRPGFGEIVIRVMGVLGEQVVREADRHESGGRQEEASGERDGESQPQPSKQQEQDERGKPGLPRTDARWEQISCCNGNMGTVNSVAWSGDGEMIASGAEDDTVR